MLRLRLPIQPPYRLHGAVEMSGSTQQLVDRQHKQQLLWLALAAMVLLPIYYASGFRVQGVFDANSWQVMGQFVDGFFPPRLDQAFLQFVLRASGETIAVATLGLAGAFVIGAPLSLIISRALSLSEIGPANYCFVCKLLRWPFRFFALLIRSLPEIVWALLFVRMTGLGPMAAVLAIAVSYGGMLAKVYNEIMESGALEPSRALMLGGAGRLQAFFFGVLPSVYRELLSYTVYRWECALRASVIMGFVGAGGLGQQLELSMRHFQGSEAATLLLAFFLLVLLADGISALLRWAVR
ncbi:phosphonate ABC transporter permease subunit PhnE [Permianibacter aggregans]|uniref:Phosphonate ABC transporter permease subunit PhnE n=2 Tax=Permianibacter aggregans TaxID=1510150 RepID=A0A4R6UFA0_9GAMM|nr:phosphonate ABC transporter permease subunit PhnE [Permianibacter aggregans]